VTGSGSPTESGPEPEPARLDGIPAGVLAAALRMLGAGVALVDGKGRVIAEDPRFSVIQQLVDDPGASGDASSFASAWTGLIDGVRQGLDARQTVRLKDGRTLEMMAAAAGDGSAVVAVTPVARADEPARLSSGTAHEINNILGGMLANIYMALVDLDPQNPVRARLEAVNDAALAIRNQVRPASIAIRGRSR